MEYAVHVLLARTTHAVQNHLRPHLSKLGLSLGQPKILRCLVHLGPGLVSVRERVSSLLSADAGRLL